MSRWTRSRVEKLAPDASSIAAAKKLARPGPWTDTGATDSLVWGKCQGSGSTPYQVSVDLDGPAVKCTCPSRKFPCKHGLALLLLWVEGDGNVADAAEPAAFAGDWAADRAVRAQARENRVETRQSADPAAAAKRLERRLTLMTEGAADFELWLCDLYRQGLASARQRPYEFWDTAAKRLTDSQLPGLAARVRDLPALLYTPDAHSHLQTHTGGWADAVLAETGRWFTAVRAWQRRDDLDTDDLANLRAFLGWPVPSEEVIGGPPGTTDTAHHEPGPWVVEGLHRDETGRIASQRTWLRSTLTQQRRLVLEFGSRDMPLCYPLRVGSLLDVPLAPYPGSGIRRAAYVTEPSVDDGTVGPPTTTHRAPVTIDGALAAWADELATNPFVDRLPVTLLVRVVSTPDGALVVDPPGAALPLDPDVEPWELMARCGDAPVPMFCELEGGVVRPLSIEVDGALVSL